MADPATKVIYLRVSKTLADRITRRRNATLGETDEQLYERLLRIGLLIDAMPDGSNIFRKRGAILGLDTEYIPDIDPSF